MIVNGYCTADQLANELGAEAGPDLDKFERAINAASRLIDKHCGDRFWQDTAVATREFYSEDTRCCYIPEGISTTSGLVVKIDPSDDGTWSTTLTLSTGFILKPNNSADEIPVEPYREIVVVNSDGGYFNPSVYGRANVQVTAKFGWPAVPDDVTEACLIQAASLMKGTSSPGGILELSGFDGIGQRLGRIHPQAAALLEGRRVVYV